MDKLMEKVTEIDDEVPPLPAKDAIHRIYRDVSPTITRSSTGPSILGFY